MALKRKRKTSPEKKSYTGNLTLFERYQNYNTAMGMDYLTYSFHFKTPRFVFFRSTKNLYFLAAPLAECPAKNASFFYVLLKCFETCTGPSMYFLSLLVMHRV